MMYFYAPLNDVEREKLWIGKRAKLQAADYFIEELNETITTQKGWWFSAHEQWKYPLLPYTSSPLNKQVFLNGEKIRTWNSKVNKLPGMFASVTSTIATNDQQLNYFSDCGVQEVAFERVGRKEVVTPYSTMSLFIADEGVAAAWYHNMISGPAGQTMYGSIEALMTSGAEISPMLTWDSKITSVVGMMGGLQEIVGAKMHKHNILEPFLDKINYEWSLVFGNGTLKGENVGYALPEVGFPQPRDDFTTCRETTISHEYFLL